MELLSSCPVCNKSDFTQFISCKDYTVSRETFIIQSCNSCGLKFTNPRPQGNLLSRYYESDEYVSHSKNTSGFINSVYYIVKNYSILKKIQLINRLAPKGKILDYGCGTGDFLRACKVSGWDVAGVEPNHGARASAQTLLGTEIHPTIQHRNSQNENFNIITLWHVLEHISDLDHTVDLLLGTLKPGGILLIAVPNCNSYDAANYGKFWAAYDVPRHLYHFVPETITRYLKTKNLSLIKTLPMPLDSFYVSMLSEKYIAMEKGTNLIPRMLRALYRGFVSNIKAIAKPGTSSSQIFIFRKPAK